MQSLVKKYAPTWLYTTITLSDTRPSVADSTLLTRDFDIAFYNMPLTSGIRSLKSRAIGRLLAISGTVTRTSEVRPELISGTFVCEGCRTHVRDIEQQFKYTEVGLLLRPRCTGLTRSAVALPEHDMPEQEWLAAQH